MIANEARALGLLVKVGMPLQVMEFMKLTPNQFNNPVSSTFRRCPTPPASLGIAAHLLVDRAQCPLRVIGGHW